ncbi:MAG: flavodoxin family protein [Verrucomicrobiota bacterium]|jgi:multimeric flavodoxin WrbA|nr:flavodoxin family protein [Verrucomicrobiota bacterium]
MSPASKKKKMVLVLLGSPREDGNSTRLAYAFADGASLHGHTVESIRLSALKLKPCTVCGSCRETVAAGCVQKDDLQAVYPLLRKADVVVFATPLHFYTWSTWLKILMDRLYCLAPHRPRNLRGKTTALLATAADSSAGAFAGLKATYRLTASYMGWESIGEILVPGVEAEGDIAGKPKTLKKAEALGAALA